MFHHCYYNHALLLLSCCMMKHRCYFINTMHLALLLLLSLMLRHVSMNYKIIILLFRHSTLHLGRKVDHYPEIVTCFHFFEGMVVKSAL